MKIIDTIYYNFERGVGEQNGGPKSDYGVKGKRHSRASPV